MSRKAGARRNESERGHAAKTASGYERILQRFLEWAEGRTDVRAAVVVGSRARTDHPADEWADLDLVVFVEEPGRYVDDADWVEEIAQPWITFVEPTAIGNQQERRVLFEGGLDVDFAFVPASALGPVGTDQTSAAFFEVARRGYRILLDPGGALAAASSPPSVSRTSIPSGREVLEVVNDFGYHAVWTAKHLRRGELWWAKSGCDGRMKDLLRRMMEWHARAVHAPSLDTWMRGRYLEEWADPRAKRALRKSFAHYDEADVWRALLATMGLFRWLARETLQRLRVPYPAAGDRHATELVRQLYRGRAGNRPRRDARRAH